MLADQPSPLEWLGYLDDDEEFGAKKVPFGRAQLPGSLVGAGFSGRGHGNGDLDLFAGLDLALQRVTRIFAYLVSRDVDQSQAHRPWPSARVPDTPGLAEPLARLEHCVVGDGDVTCKGRPESDLGRRGARGGGQGGRRSRIEKNARRDRVRCFRSGGDLRCGRPTGGRPIEERRDR